MANLYVALLHYPMKSLKGGVVATAITSLDVVDIARSCRTYNVSSYFIVHPLESQRTIVQRILEFWREERPSRKEAVEIVSVVEDLEDCVRAVSEREGEEPLIWGTSARPGLPYPRITWEEAREHLRTKEKPVLLLFGTGNGMAEELLWACDALLPPVREKSDYNHLSVRAAAAIILDRLKGDEG
jgi:hypothetical protein